MKVKHACLVVMTGLFLTVMLSGCISGGPVSPEATSTPTADDSTLLTLPKATPYAELPAAGICASPEGEMVTINIYPDIPDPRCSQVRAEQKLTIINKSMSTLQLSIGVFKSSLLPGSSYTIDFPFGDYLEPGVHQVVVTPCCNADLWLESK